MPAPYPRARDDLQVLRRNTRGETVYVIGDTITGAHKELDELQYLVLGLLDGQHTLDELAETLTNEHELEVTADELGQFIDALQDQSLLDPATDLRIDGKDQAAMARDILTHLASDGVVLARRDVAGATAGVRKGPERRIVSDESRLMDVAVRELHAGNIRTCAAAVRHVLDINRKNHRARYLHTRILEAHLAQKDRGTLFFRRVPLWNPNRFLLAASRAVGDVLISRFAAVVWLAFLAAVFVTLISRSGTLAENTSSVADINLLLDPVVILAVLLLRFINIATHEVAHGFFCRHFGGYVREIGLLFVGPAPGAYCDVSSTYMVEPRARRLLVYFAGPIADSIMFAILILLMTAEGFSPTTYAILFVSSFTILVGIVLNVVPLLRNDSYLALSDALSYPNLLEDGFHVQEWFLFKLLVDWRIPLDPGMQARFRLLAIYGIAARAVVVVMMVFSIFTSVRTLVSYFAGFGVVAAAVIIALLGRTLWTRVSDPGRRLFRAAMTTRHGRLAFSILGIALVFALAFPFPRHVTVEATVEQPGEDVRPRVSGVVRDVAVVDGARVKQGEPLLTLADDDLRMQRLAVEERIAASHAMLAAAQRGVRPEEAAVARQAARSVEIERSAAARALRREQELAARGLSRQADQDALRALARRLETSSREASAAATALLSDRNEDTVAILRSSIEADEAVLQEVKALQEQMTLRAPFDGVVVITGLPRHGGVRGMKVEAGADLFRVIATAGVAHIKLEVPFTIPPDDLRAGAVAELVARSAGGRRLPITLTAVGKTIRRRAEGQASALILDVDAQALAPEARDLPDGSSGVARIPLDATPVAWRAFRFVQRAISYDLQRALGDAGV